MSIRCRLGRHRYKGVSVFTGRRMTAHECIRCGKPRPYSLGGEVAPRRIEDSGRTYWQVCPARQLTDPDEAEALGLTADGGRERGAPDVAAQSSESRAGNRAIREGLE